MPGRRPIDITQFSTDRSNLKSNVSPKSASNTALKSLGLSQFYSTSSLQLSSVISDETGTGNLVFNTDPTLYSPSLGSSHTRILTNVAETGSTTANQVLMSFPMYSMSNKAEVYGAVDIIIHTSIGNTTGISTPASIIQKKLTKLLVLFDNDTDWALNPAPAIQDQDREVYHTEYANITTGGYGAVSSTCSYNVILNTANLRYDLVVTPASTKYMRYKIIATCLISDDLLFNAVGQGV